MGKMMAYSLMTVFIIEVALTFFTGTTQVHTALYDALINPTDFENSSFYVYGMLLIITLAAAAVIVPSFVYQSNQWAMFALGVATLITYVTVLVHLWTFLNGAFTAHFTAEISALICSIVCAPLLILYVTAMIEWTRFNQ